MHQEQICCPIPPTRGTCAHTWPPRWIPVMMLSGGCSLYADSKNQPHHLCMVVYYVPDGFTPSVQPHGNTRHGKAFFPAFPSTLSAIKEQCVSGKGEVVSKVSSAVGGIKNALDRCELPRNESQATYVKRQLKTNSSPLLLVSATNELSVVMHKA